VAVNCGAIPADLLESELFGHERGAFTGAVSARKGRFEIAEGGTLFLDEIGDMSPTMQVKLLRVLQERVFERVGNQVPMRCNVRIIAATHRNLEDSIQRGAFREDLFHRLNVIRVRIPPLRERREDIELLLRHFLDAAAKELKTEPKHLLPEVLERLKAFDWLGNVRQLENACRWLTVMAPGRDIHLQDLPPELRQATAAPVAAEVAPVAEATPHAAAAPAAAGGASVPWNEALGRWAEARLAAGQSDLLGEAAPLFERTLINMALAACKGQRQEAARRLGWGRNTLTRKIKELGIED